MFENRKMLDVHFFWSVHLTIHSFMDENLLTNQMMWLVVIYTPSMDGWIAHQSHYVTGCDLHPIHGWMNCKMHTPKKKCTSNITLENKLIIPSLNHQPNGGFEIKAARSKSKRATKWCLNIRTTLESSIKSSIKPN